MKNNEGMKTKSALSRFTLIKSCVVICSLMFGFSNMAAISVVDTQAKIELKINGATESQLDSIVVTASYSQLFSDLDNLNRVELNRKANIFSTVIDVDTDSTRVLLTLYSPENMQEGPSAMGIIYAVADEITTIDLDYNQLHYFTFSNSGSGFNLWLEENAVQQLLGYNPNRVFSLITDDSDLSDWQSFGNLIKRIEADQLAVLHSTAGENLSPAAYNALHQLISGNWLLKAQMQHEIMAGLRSVNYQVSFPSEFYKPLNQIDFSDGLLNHSLLLPPRYILDKILNADIFSIDPIGNMPISQWQKSVNQSLGKVIDHPTSLLLDLLTAVSYLNQIDRNQLLTDAQLSNISNWSNRPLANRVLTANNSVAAILKTASGELFDMSKAEVDLHGIIEKYKGKKVIVDMWNTWCAPCGEARKILEAITLPDDVVVIGVADTSSDIEQWQLIAARQAGPQYLISEGAAEQIMRDNRLRGIPAFIVFDNEGRIIYKGVGTESVAEAVKALGE